MGLYEQLLERQELGNPVRVGVVGAGKFGTMFLAQVQRIPGIHVVGVADLRVDVAKSNMIYAGWSAEKLNMPSLDAALTSGGTHVGEDAMAVINCTAVDIVIECTGNPVIAVEHCLASFSAGKHVISATVEADAVCGAALAARAKAAGVIYSQAYGDQPAMTVELVDWARTCGFEVAAAGRGHKWKPEYRFSTPDTVWDHYGLTAEQAQRGRLNPKMFNSFLDGTKPAIECAAISNATGLNAPTNGLTYPSGSIDDIAALMRPRTEGGALEELGMVEVISCLAEDGSMIPNDIRLGVWVVVKATSEYQKNCFEEYMVSTDDSGLYFCNFKRFHLIGLELGLSVGSVAIRREATGTAKEFRSDVVAVSKKDLKAGEMLDGEGGFCVAGQLRPSAKSVPMRALPLGLTGDIKLVRDVPVDTILTYDDVEIDEGLHAVKLRRECEAMV
ncbi:NAD(P)H-dependent oxidoreductase [Tropicimonas sediminicola]|uniref:Predicted homoserine dehydrogenase, contains C-terminal SAF domain n=1 Tax=Tropicimonas sediminicola TaxID=1031541 RepID=A0A239I175_9RHOB|nr:flagellar biosynthesis protein FlgA [Tropicimonas sediminicola]SNS87269.1 Predicted homoserine dehydrogenase, contains C-terminal SAF domain [Tropicimonas sediminicola]